MGILDDLYLMTLRNLRSNEKLAALVSEWIADAEETLNRYEREGMVSEEVRRLRDESSDE